MSSGHVQNSPDNGNSTTPQSGMSRTKRSALTSSTALERPAPTPVPSQAQPVLNPTGGSQPPSAKFPLAELQAGVPDGVDPTKKEEHLTDEDFMEAFKVRFTWQRQAHWRSTQITNQFAHSAWK